MASFLYPLKKSENFTVFWCFLGVEKECIENECVNTLPTDNMKLWNYISEKPNKQIKRKVQVLILGLYISFTHFETSIIMVQF